MCTHWPSLEHQLFIESIVRNKAVADGAVSFYIDHHVTARVAKFTCGADVNILDYHNSAIHISRSSKELVDVVGEESIGDVFKPILPKAPTLFPLDGGIILTTSVLLEPECQ